MLGLTRGLIIIIIFGVLCVYASPGLVLCSMYGPASSGSGGASSAGPPRERRMTVYAN